MGDYQYPVLQRALAIQRMVLSRFLDGDVLRSLQEIALQVDPGQDVLQLPEVFDALTDSIWTEVPAAKPGVKADQKVEIHTMRRNLQREHVRSLARLVLGPRRDAILSIEILLYGGGEGPVPPDLPQPWRGSTSTTSIRGFKLRWPTPNSTRRCEPTSQSCTSRSRKCSRRWFR